MPGMGPTCAVFLGGGGPPRWVLVGTLMRHGQVEDLPRSNLLVHVEGCRSWADSPAVAVFICVRNPIAAAAWALLMLGRLVVKALALMSRSELPSGTAV